MKAIALSLVLLCSSGCSVVMAVQGVEEPDMSVLEIGSTRGQIEVELGQPRKSEPGPDESKIDTYYVELGNAPSPTRAVLHGALDVLTLAIWEIVGTPIEYLQGSIKTVQVTYDRNDYAADIKVLSDAAAKNQKAADSEKKS